jgi:hypothetical protein
VAPCDQGYSSHTKEDIDMSASKNRPCWHQLPSSVRTAIEHLLGRTVVQALNCPGGYSAGFASVLTLADGQRFFVKGIDAERWPTDATFYRTEARVNAALPATISAPRLLGTFDDGQWIVLAFEAVDGVEPSQPWNKADLTRVVAAVVHQGQAGTPSPIALPRDHPRLGGWSEIAANPEYLGELARHSRWAIEHIPVLIRLEREGVTAAQGDSLLHFDLSPHNILLTPHQVVFVDWPGARLGAPVVDLIMVLSSAPTGLVDRETIVASHYPQTTVPRQTIDAILAAHAGCLLRGGVSPKPPGLEPIIEIERQLGLSALAWLQQRLAN